MARTSRRDASENIGEVLAMMRHSFSTSDSVRYLLALVVLRWLADAKRQDYPLPYPLDLPPDLEYHIPLMQPPDLPDWLERMLHELEQRNQQELGGVFQHLHFRSPCFTFNQPDRGILGRAIDLLWMKDRHGCSLALLGASLDAARRAMVINSGAPEMNTPDSICALATALVRPSCADVVYDPACGTGTMLLQCKEYVETETPAAWSLAGAERNPAAWMVAKLSVLSQGFSSRGIRRADVLRFQAPADDAGAPGKYDVVMSHFPWSRKEWRNDDTAAETHPVFRAGLPPKNNADYAYISHMVSALKPGSGRMTAVVSTGVLSRTGNEGRIRARLVKDDLVDTVIALPDKMFQFTPVAAALLVIRRDRAPGRGILFIDARGMAVQSKGANTLPPDRVQNILQLYSRRTQQEGVAALVDPLDVAANGYSLSVALYVQQPVAGEPHDLVEVRARRKELREQLRKLNDRIDALLVTHAHPAEELEREAVTE